MQRRTWLALLFLGALLVQTAACRCSRDRDEAPASAPHGEAVDPRSEHLSVQSMKLDNGLQVDVVSGPCGDAVTLAALFRVGIDHDPAGRSGLVHLVRRLLSTSLAKGAGTRVVEIGDSYTLYTATVAGADLTSELDAVAAWMSRFAVTDADLQRERAVLLEELAMRRGKDAAATARSYAEESVRPTRGDGKRHGIATEVEAITLDELRAFWTAHITAGNARVVVLGRFDDSGVRAHINAALAAAPGGTPPVQRDPTGTSVRGTLVVGEAPSAVAMAVPAPALSSPLYPSFLVLAARLMDGTADRSWQVDYDPIRRPGLLLITGTVMQTERPDTAVQRIRGQVARLLEQSHTPEASQAAQRRFRLLLLPHLTDPALCTSDPRAFAIAHVRRSQLDGAPTAQALQAGLQAIDEQQLSAARELFGPRHTAAVVAGGAIR